MALIADRVAETTTTTGTGTVTLAGAKSGYRAFSAAFSVADQVYYAIVGATEWEVGIGTLGSGTLARTTLLASSTGSAVSFSAGTKDVFCTAPASLVSGALGPYADTTALESAKPAASNGGRVALVGASAPYAPYMSDGTTWGSLSQSGGDPYVAIATSGTSQSINIGSAGVVDITLTANCTLSFTGAISGSAFSLRLIVRQDSTGSRSITWPASTKWTLGAAPTLSTPANSIDEVVLMTYDGGTTFFGDFVARARA